MLWLLTQSDWLNGTAALQWLSNEFLQQHCITASVFTPASKADASAIVMIVEPVFCQPVAHNWGRGTFLDPPGEHDQ
jgi:hypothetical protein